MNKIVSLALLFVAAMTSCAQEPGQKFSGTTAESVEKIYIMKDGGKPADSVAVSKGKFVYAANLPKNTIVTFVQKGGRMVTAIADGTDCEIDMNTESVKGSKESEKLNGYLKQTMAAEKAYRDLYMQYRQLSADKERSAAALKAIEQKLDSIDNEDTKTKLAIINDNKDNIIPAAFIGDVYYSMAYDDLAELLKPGTAYYDSPMLDRAKKHLSSLEKRKPGKTFIDLTMNDDQGKERKLSEWCGKGNYVLIDFWASWCGPCRMEMPNVVANYEKYHAKGFEVIGVSFDSNEGAWKNGVKALGLAWPQLSDLKGWKSEGASAYGIASIPSNVLVDGEGKIIANNLRGEDLGAMLKEIYGF